MRAEDLMTPEVVTLRANDTIADAIEKVTEYEVRHLPVVGEDGIVGVVSDRDLRRVEGLLAQHIGEPDRSANVLGSPVTALLSGEPVMCRPSTDVDEVIDLMLEDAVGSVIVCDDDRGPVGIVSITDILEAARGRLS